MNSRIERIGRQLIVNMNGFNKLDTSSEDLDKRYKETLKSITEVGEKMNNRSLEIICDNKITRKKGIRENDGQHESSEKYANSVCP